MRSAPAGRLVGPSRMEPTVSRDERQRQQVRAALARGHYARVLVLAREHLAEFPDDEIVRAALAEATAAWEHPGEPPSDPG